MCRLCTVTQIKEQPAQRVLARFFHGSVSDDDRLARQKADMLPLVNDLCRRLGCTKVSTVVVMHRSHACLPHAPLSIDLILCSRYW